MLAHNREALFEGGQSLFGVLRVVSIQAEFGDTPRLLSDALLPYMDVLAREFQRGFGGDHKAMVALRPINSGGKSHMVCIARPRREEKRPRQGGDLPRPKRSVERVRGS